jgi:hypothetical protein
MIACRIFTCPLHLGKRCLAVRKNFRGNELAAMDGQGRKAKGETAKAFLRML